MKIVQLKRRTTRTNRIHLLWNCSDSSIHSPPQRFKIISFAFQEAAPSHRSSIGVFDGRGSAGLQARVEGREEELLQPLRSATSAAEARDCAGALTRA